MAATKRIYLVRDSSKLESHPPRLVEAASQAEVRSHLQKPLVISVPDTREVLDLVQSKAVVVEKVGVMGDAEQAALRG